MLIQLSLFQLLVIALTNYLVQFPLEIFGWKTTWGAFTYPLIFLSTDLTVRLLGQHMARKVIFIVMLPALLISYIISTVFFDGIYQGISNIFVFNIFISRIVLASFSAYIFGQLLDITIFNRLRKAHMWWLPPLLSTTLGVLIDSFIFFSIAFYHSSNPFMANNWIEIGFVDTVFKLFISTLFMLPLYRIILSKLIKT
jgi:hypothetical protein